MSVRQRFLSSLAVAVVATLVGTALAEGQSPTPSITTLSVESRATPLAAYDGSVLWSSYDPRLRRYSLTAFVGGAVRKLPVGTRRIPFDADLGPGPDGHLNAVYSRCLKEKEKAGADTAQEALNRRGCRLWRFDFRRRRETRINTSTPRGASDFRPTIWRGRVAFGRLSAAGSGAPRLYTRSGSKAPVRRVRKPTTRLSGAATTYLARLDLRGDRLISSWQYREAQCRAREASVSGDSASEIFVGSVRAQERLLDACDLDDPVDVRDGVWTAGAISVLLLRPTSTGFASATRTYSPTGRLRREEPLPSSATSFAQDRDVQYFVSFRPGQSGGPDAYDIVRTVAD